MVCGLEHQRFRFLLRLFVAIQESGGTKRTLWKNAFVAADHISRAEICETIQMLAASREFEKISRGYGIRRAGFLKRLGKTDIGSRMDDLGSAPLEAAELFGRNAETRLAKISHQRRHAGKSFQGRAFSGLLV